MNYRKLIQDELAKLHTANGMKADPLLDSDLGADIVADICRNVVNKTCNIPHVMQQSELLTAFLKWYWQNVDGRPSDESISDIIDAFGG